MSSRARILIADDHRLVAELCRNLLEAEFDVVGVVTNGLDLLEAAPNLRPDVIVTDIAMPGSNGLMAGRQLKQSLQAVKLVYLTMHTDPDLALRAIECGASGYLVKTCAAAELVLAVRQALRGRTYVSPTLKEKVTFLQWEQKKPVEETERLTERQRQVLQLLAEGKDMFETGSILNITARTVAFPKYRMMEVLGVKTGAELVRYAVQNQLIAA